jgi:hypothetical protein
MPRDEYYFTLDTEEILTVICISKLNAIKIFEKEITLRIDLIRISTIYIRHTQATDHLILFQMLRKAIPIQA